MKENPRFQSLTALPSPLPALITNQGEPHKIPSPPQMKDTLISKMPKESPFGLYTVTNTLACQKHLCNRDGQSLCLPTGPPRHSHGSASIQTGALQDSRSPARTPQDPREQRTSKREEQAATTIQPAVVLHPGSHCGPLGQPPLSAPMGVT